MYRIFVSSWYVFFVGHVIFVAHWKFENSQTLNAYSVTWPWKLSNKVRKKLRRTYILFSSIFFVTWCPKNYFFIKKVCIKNYIKINHKLWLSAMVITLRLAPTVFINHQSFMKKTQHDRSNMFIPSKFMTFLRKHHLCLHILPY